MKRDNVMYARIEEGVTMIICVSSQQEFHASYLFTAFKPSIPYCKGGRINI